MRFLTAGESHGKYQLAVIDGFPANFPISIDFINKKLILRQSGYGRGKRMRIEKDKINFLTGVRGGKTIGSPVTLAVENNDYKNWEKIMAPYKKVKNENIKTPRPAHADLFGYYKYGFSDIRNVIERASARETVMRVAVGALCADLLRKFNIEFCGCVKSIGPVYDDFKETNFSKIKNKISKSNLRVYSSSAEKEMIKYINDVKKEGDSAGGIVEVRVKNFIPLAGSYSQWHSRLDAKLAYYLMSIPAVKGVEIGDGFNYSFSKGSLKHDQIEYKNSKINFLSNSSGGIVGGISTGQDIIIRCAMKPIPTTIKKLRTVNLKTKKNASTRYERSDVCAVTALSVIAECFTAVCLAAEFLNYFNGDDYNQIKNQTALFKKKHKEIYGS